MGEVSAFYLRRTVNDVARRSEGRVVNDAQLHHKFKAVYWTRMPYESCRRFIAIASGLITSKAALLCKFPYLRPPEYWVRTKLRSRSWMAITPVNASNLHFR